MEKRLIDPYFAVVHLFVAISLQLLVLSPLHACKASLFVAERVHEGGRAFLVNLSVCLKQIAKLSVQRVSQLYCNTSNSPKKFR